MKLYHTYYYFIIGVLLLSTANLRSQNRGVFTKNSISISIGHTMVAKGVEDGSKKWLSLPSWAIDYKLSLSENWALGLQNDIILTDFEVESFENNEVITRSNPFSSMLVVGYLPVEELLVFIGGGAEFASEENFVMLRVGAEPSYEINERLELVAGLTYDIKVDGYDSFGINLGVGYKF